MQLYANKLLYSCDIALAALETDQEISFKAQGHFRMGPMKSKVQVQSQFEKNGEDLLFKNYRLDVERMNFFENYEMKDGKIFYSNSKGQSITIDLNNQAFQDPLSFVFQLASEGKEFVQDKEIPLLIGKKIEKISSQKINGLIEIIKKSKLLAKVKNEIDKVIIEVPKLKIKLQLLFK